MNELQIPDWVNVEYFTKVLRNNEKDFRKLEKLSAVPASDPEESYTSINLRVYVTWLNKDGDTVEHSYILKTMLESQNLIEFIKSLGLFPKEKEIYSKLLPEFQYLYTQHGVQEKLGPHCVLAEETPKRITLLLEDLKTLGFGHADRLAGMDMQHMTAALQKLAKFHASTVVWQAENGNFGDKFKVGLVAERSRGFFEERSHDMIEAFKLAMQTWPLENKERIMSKLPSAQQYVDELIRLSSIKSEDFNVLCHGDLWNDNIMFRYANDELDTIEDTVFVDFQLCKYGRPTYDLYGLIFSAAALDIKTSQMSAFLALYHKALQESLTTLKYKGFIPTLQHIQDMMQQDHFYAFFMVLGYLPIILMPPDGVGLDERLKCGENAQSLRLKSMTNPLYVEQICQILPWLCEQGYLDY